MKFGYLKILLPQKSEFFGTAVLKPIIPIRLTHKDKTIKYDALIDSGADFCIFDAQIGEILGIDIKSGLEVGFGGIQNLRGSSAFVHDVSLIIGGWNYETAVGFSYDVAKHGFGILGQKGFFDIFSVRFDYSKEEIELKERR